MADITQRLVLLLNHIGHCHILVPFPIVTPQTFHGSLGHLWDPCRGVLESNREPFYRLAHHLIRASLGKYFSSPCIKVGTMETRIFENKVYKWHLGGSKEKKKLL